MPGYLCNQTAPDGRALTELSREQGFELLASHYTSPHPRVVRSPNWLLAVRLVAQGGVCRSDPSLHFLDDGRQARVRHATRRRPASVQCPPSRLK